MLCVKLIKLNILKNCFKFHDGLHKKLLMKTSFNRNTDEKNSSKTSYNFRYVQNKNPKCFFLSGKLRGQRAKTMKFTDGRMIHAGQPVRDYVDTAVRHVRLRQGEYKS